MPMPQVSSSAPPTFRVKKKKPGEVNPAPQNGGRTTGPPMQMGAGQGSMFADGRKGQAQGNPPRTPNMPMAGPGPSRVHGQPQYAPPVTPNYPRTSGPMPQGQMQGQHPRGVPTATMHMADGRRPGGMPMRSHAGMPMRAPMMADGGMDAPDPIGGMPDDDTDQSMAPGDGSAAPDAGSGQMPIIKPESVAYHDDAQSCSTCQFYGDGGQCAVLQMQVSEQGGCNAFEGAAPGGDQGPMDTGAGFAQNPDGTSGAPSLG